nr:hypothetical protein L203_05001 [Cryptococcus depauperatus CBS 7841]
MAQKLSLFHIISTRPQGPSTLAKGLKTLPAQNISDVSIISVRPLWRLSLLFCFKETQSSALRPSASAMKQTRPPYIETNRISPCPLSTRQASLAADGSATHFPNTQDRKGETRRETVEIQEAYDPGHIAILHRGFLLNASPIAAQDGCQGETTVILGLCLDGAYE